MSLSPVQLPHDGQVQWRVKTQPQKEPVDVQGIKDYARIDGTAEDEMLKGFIRSVRQAVEGFLGRSLITQTLVASFDWWPSSHAFTRGAVRGVSIGGEGNFPVNDPTFGLPFPLNPGPVELPRPPLISVVEVRTLDEDDTETVYSSDNYFTRANGEFKSVLIIKRGATPPVNTERSFGGYEIEYTAGYGSAPSDVPGPIVEGIKMWVSLIYENRVPIAEPPPHIQNLLMSYKVMDL